MWIYWAEQCEYCKLRNRCKYRRNVEGYIAALRDVDSSDTYGSLRWNCDYFDIDAKEYNRKHPGGVKDDFN